jgi:hypothetical protein
MRPGGPGVPAFHLECVSARLGVHGPSQDQQSPLQIAERSQDFVSGRKVGCERIRLQDLLVPDSFQHPEGNSVQSLDLPLGTRGRYSEEYRPEVTVYERLFPVPEFHGHDVGIRLHRFAHRVDQLPGRVPPPRPHDASSRDFENERSGGRIAEWQQPEAAKAPADLRYLEPDSFLDHLGRMEIALDEASGAVI